MISRPRTQATAAPSESKETDTVTRLRRLASPIPDLPRASEVAGVRRAKRGFGAAGFVALMLGMLLVSAPAASAAAPAWDIQIEHGTFTGQQDKGEELSFHPGPFHRPGPGVRLAEQEPDYYIVRVTNVGDAPTSGPYTTTVILPPGLMVGLASDDGNPVSGCSGSTGDTVLVCGSTAPVAPGSTLQAISIRVLVAPDAPDLVTNTVTVSGGGAAEASATDPTPVFDRPPWVIESFTSRTTDEFEADYTAAGGHPSQNTTKFAFPSSEPPTLAFLKDAAVTIEPGFIGNPAAAPRCPSGGIKETEAASNCPPGSRVGTAILQLELRGGAGPKTQQPVPIYNMITERGYPAQFGFYPASTNTLTVLSVIPLPRSESYGLTIGSTNVPKVGVMSFKSIFCAYGTQGDSCKSPSATSEAPFLSNPLDCPDPQPTWKIAADSWEQAGSYLPSGFPNLSDPNWKTASVIVPPVIGCDDPLLASQFDATSIATKPLQPGGGPVQADQPSGLKVDLDFPQANDPTDLNAGIDNTLPQTPEPKDITVTLPAGLSVSPSSADGLGACSDLASDPAGDQVHYDDTRPVRCPDSSKIGSVVATTPLLALHDTTDEDKIIGPEPIPGDVYLLKPHPGDLSIGGGSSDGKFRLLIQLENAERGINIKLPGTAIADKQTGQLTTVFADNPQLPASHLTVSLKTGPRAPLATPVTCGRFDTAAHLVPWGSPGVPDANKTASFDVGSGPNGSACANTPAQRPFAPTMSAGTESSAAGQSSPFVLRLGRNDGEQEFSSLEATLPKGLAAKFVGIPYCPDPALAAAATRPGKAEQANPSCPASRIGSVTVGAGPGTNPFHTQGTAYLAGPYKGAPMSVAVITPAVAGPFDLGTVVVRNALYVDPETAQGRVVSDPFPKIIDGVPLKLRSILVNLDRPSFTLNPTNCSPLAINATITSTDGASAKPSNRFQASACDKLGFKPDLKLSLKGGTERSDHPALKATLTYPKGNYANIAKAVVSLPHSEFLAQNHIKTICTRVQFAADQCPKGSIYGFVTATTPLLDKPLEGPLYLRSSSHPLPDLVAALHGQIDVDLVGRIDSKNGGIRTTFESVPDAPVTKFVLTMQGGKKGLLENSKDLCNSVNKADVKFTAQNGKTANYKTPLTNSCKKRGKGKKGKSKGKSSRAAASWLPGLGF